MATPSIGAIEFLTLQGRVPPCATVAKEHSRDGLDGHRLLQVGERGALVPLTTVRDFDTAAAAQTHIGDCCALQGGDLVTVTYSDGQTTGNVFIRQVFPPERVSYSPVVAGGLTEGKWRVRMQWHVFQAQPE